MDPLDNRFDKLDNAARTGYLIGGFITGTLSIEEREELDAWVLESESNMQLFEDMTDEPMVGKFMQWLATRDTEGKLMEAKQRLKFKQGTPTLSWWHYAAAACVVGIIGWAVYTYSSMEWQEQEPAGITEQKADILPGSSVAELHLPGGKIIELNAVKDTLIGSIVIKDGEVLYESNGLDTAMHEIIIPRKGFYKLALPDGSKVWLNNESSIRYPGAFGTDRREVSITGEAFFEIAKDRTRPFIVKMDELVVQAIGTAFNMNGFDSTVTLTEGVIQVTGEGNRVVLKPGEQVSSKWKVKKVDTSPVVAWTTNQFKFKNLKIGQIMAILQRWYDCKVIYEDSVGYHFNGTIDRSVPVSRVLELLEGTGHVHFTIQENTVRVKK